MKLWGIVTAILASSLLSLAGLGPSASEATTTFIGSTIERIDAAQQTITFRTREGQSWTLRLADPKLLTKEPISKGDQVSIEIDPNDRITKIVKLAQLPESGQTQPPGQSAPSDY